MRKQAKSVESARKAGDAAADQTDLSQAEKFAQVAREHGTDQDEEAFKGVLLKLGKPKRD